MPTPDVQQHAHGSTQPGQTGQSLASTVLACTR